MMHHWSRLLLPWQKSVVPITESSEQTRLENHTNSKLLSLPAEILLEILQHLTLSSALMFGFVCKSAHHLIQYELTEREVRTGFPLFISRQVIGQCLTLIAQDDPRFLSCSKHLKLYNWRSQKHKHFNCSDIEGSSPNAIVICNKGCRPGSWTVPEPIRILILRYHLRGPEYGLPSSDYRHICYKNGCSKPNEVNLRVDQNTQNLLVQRIHHHRIQLHSQTVLRDSFIDLYDFNCWHSWSGITAIAQAALRTIGHYPPHRAPIINALGHASGKVARRILKPSPRTWKCPIVFKCDQCATDFTVQFTYPAPTAVRATALSPFATSTIEFRFEIYQNLGGLSDDFTTCAQRQVLAPIQACSRRPLDKRNKIGRLQEDLKSVFHETESPAYCSPKTHVVNSERSALSSSLLSTSSLPTLPASTTPQNDVPSFPCNVGFLSQWTATDHEASSWLGTRDLSGCDCKDSHDYGPRFKADIVSPKTCLQGYAGIPFELVETEK